MPWLSRVLFLLTMLLALTLLGLVLVAPWLDTNGARGWGRVLALFAEDRAVRRTGLASALGLVVTAYVFFRPRPSHTAKSP